jgi:cytidine deaminase
MNTPEPDALVQQTMEAAKKARLLAHAPYSQYLVGAALRIADNARIITGCNVENRSFGLTICAERSAVCAAVAAGATDFDHLALALDGAQPPCGACLQVLTEFCESLPIWVTDPTLKDAKPILFRLEELLPHRFVLRR